jgi:hypothetical protein
VARELLLEVLEVKSLILLEGEELLKSTIGVDDAAIILITKVLFSYISIDLLGYFCSGELEVVLEAKELTKSFRNWGGLGKARRSTVLLGGIALGLATSLYFTGVEAFKRLYTDGKSLLENS